MQKLKAGAAFVLPALILAALMWWMQPVQLQAQGGVTNFDNVAVVSDLIVGDDGTFGGNLSVSGVIAAAEFVTGEGDISIPGSLIVTGSLTVDANTLLEGNLVVSGTSTLVGATNIQGNLSDSGGAFTVADNVLIDGGADAVQLTVQGHSTNTSNLFVVENSGGTDQFSVSNLGVATVANDLTVTDDAAVNDLTVADFSNTTAQSNLTVTMNGWITPTGSLQPITAAGGVSVDGGTRIAHVTDMLTLVNVGAQTITISETTGLISAGNIALGAGDAATLVWIGSSWYQVSGSNN